MHVEEKRQLGPDSQDKVDHHGHQEENAQHGRTKTVVVRSRTTQTNGLGSPVVCD